MAKTYDIADSDLISKLRTSTYGPSIASKEAKAIKKITKPTLGEMVIPAPKQWAPGYEVPGDFSLNKQGYEETLGRKLVPGLLGKTNTQSLFDQGAFNKSTPSQDWFDQNQDAYMTPGAMENWDATHSAEFDKPRQQEDYWNDVKGERANMPQVSNRAEEAYQHTKGNMPDISTDAGLDPYYKNAREVGMRNLNSQLAARGAYGSSVGLGQIGNMLQGLGAEQANRESQYHLDRLAEQRGWEGLQGQLAQGADSSSGRIHDAKLSDLLGFGTLANNAGNARLASLLGGMGSANAAQGAETGRLAGGSSAAGSATEGMLGQEQIALQTGTQADSQNRGNAVAASNIAGGVQGAREGRIGQAWGRETEAFRIVSDIVRRAHEGILTADEAMNTAEQMLGLQGAQEAARYADSVAARGSQAWTQAVTLFVAAGGVPPAAAAAGAAGGSSAPLPPPPNVQLSRPQGI